MLTLPAVAHLKRDYGQRCIFSVRSLDCKFDPVIVKMKHYGARTARSRVAEFSEDSISKVQSSVDFSGFGGLTSYMVLNPPTVTGWVL